MDCRKTLLLISSRLDGTLTKEEESVLAEHVAACEDCAVELALQERLSVALREMGREEIQAPPELCGMVMGRLRTERRNAFLRLPAAWRKVAAAAAAVLLIAGGYAGVTAGLQVADNGKMVATAPTVNVDNGSGVSTPDKATGENMPRPDSVQPSGATSTPDVNGKKNPPGSAQDNATDNSNIAGNSVNSSKPSDAGVTPPSSEGPRALLSSGMKVNNTTLRMTVDDLSGARAKAVALAAGSGAETQVFPEQSGDKKIVVIRLTSSSGQASGLIAELERLGTLVDRQDESRDITSIYNETLVQLQDLQSQLSANQDAEKTQQLEAQAVSDKQLLDAWKAEAGKQVITLWLESR